MADPVVLISAFEVPARQAAHFIAAWERSRDCMRSQPGCIETAVHQALTPDTDFLFVSIACWQAAEAFTAAARSAGFREPAAGLAEVTSPAGPVPVCPDVMAPNRVACQPTGDGRKVCRYGSRPPQASQLH